MKFDGMFGPIDIDARHGVQTLRINGQVQGGSFTDPDATVVSRDLPAGAPGPVAESPYALGWLMAGVANPVGSGIMVGLGSGAGVAQLLYNFPSVDITVIEIDPAIAELVPLAYPVLQHYIERGRLSIVVADAVDYLSRRHDVWNFGFADGYTGGAELVSDYLPLLFVRADTIYANIIDRVDGASVLNFANVAVAAGKPMTAMFKCLPAEAYAYLPAGSLSNWIATTADINLNALQAFTPFSELSGDAVDRCRLSWDMLISHAFTVAQD